MIYAVLKALFKVLFKVVFRTEIYHRENVPADGPVILAVNHMSNLDPPLVGTFMPRHVYFMAKEELFEVPVLRTILISAKSFPVKRGSGDRGAIKAAVQILKQGKLMCLFPEGTRSKDGKVHKAEAGVGLIASMTSAPVVPACIIGTGDVLRNGKIFPKFKMIFDEPMYFTGNRKERKELGDFSESIMERIRAMKEEYGKH